MRLEIFSLTTVKMSAVSTARPKKIDPLAKTIPKNPKYNHVRSTIDTGASISKYMAKIDEIRQNYKFKKDELFKRMKITTFAQLVVQVHRINELRLTDYPGERPDTADSELQRLEGNGSPTPSLTVTETDYGRGEPETARSTLESVALGVGELDLNRPPTPPANKFVDDMLPYLLLDVRETDDFKQCRIITSKNYPKAMLSRACNFETKDMLSYKNAPGRIIILVDEEERIAPGAATTLVQRGYDNLFLLSGGLKMMYKLFPDGFVTGTPPQSISGVKPKSLEPARQDNSFCEDDINCIDIHLDKALVDKSTGSRLSKASTVSSRTSNTSRSTVRTVNSGGVSGRQPFK